VFFAIIIRQALRRGEFASVEELSAAIGASAMRETSAASRVWVKDADEILARFRRHQAPPGR
jgi:hypothetical protein